MLILVHNERQEMVALRSIDPSEALILAQFLRRNPLALEQDPGEIAQQVGIAPEVVSRILTARPQRSRSSIGGTMPKWLKAAFSAFDRATDNVSLFVLLTSVGALLLGLVLSIGFSLGRAGEVVPYLVLCATTVLHMACYFRHGQARLVIRGAGVLGAVFTIWLVATNISDLRSNPDRAAALIFVLLIVAVLIAFVYLTAGLVASVLGGYISVKREESTVLRLDRQALLERLFGLDDRLKVAAGAVESERALYQFELFRDFRDSPYVWALVLGGGLGMLSAVLTALGGDITEMSSFSLRTIALLGAAVLVTIIAIGAQILLSYSCRRVTQALLVSIVYSAASAVPYWIHFPGRPAPEISVGGHIVSLFFGIGCGLIGGLGAAIEERAARTRRLSGNDPETLLAEIIEIQRLLTPGARDITIMVVDAAKSSLMKSSADPFVAEWTFRAYQQWLEAITIAHSGAVFSTAGDGATMQFQDVGSALQAARDIQRQVTEFNQKVSRLEMPFNLRIGIHKGTVRGTIEEVQFTEVIDVAAHVEAAAPVGGIAISEPVYAMLSPAGASACDATVDGYQIYSIGHEAVV